MQKILVIGGPGNISSSTLQELVEKGYQTGLFSTPSSHFYEVDRRVRIFPGDRNETGQLERTFAEFKPDAVLDLACYTPDQAVRAVEMAAGKVAQYLFASTVDVYGYPLARLPMREADPWQEKALSQYAANKRTCEEIFLAHQDPVMFPLTIVRPAYSFGKRFILSALDRSAGPGLLYRLQKGLPVLVPGDGTTLLHVSSGYNTGRMVARLVLQQQALNNCYNLAHPTVMDYENYIRLFAACLCVLPNLVCIPSDVILSVHVPEMENNLLAELARYNIFFSIDKFLQDYPGFIFEPLEDAARRAVAWNIETGTINSQPVIDDRIITAYQKALEMFKV